MELEKCISVGHTQMSKKTTSFLNSVWSFRDSIKILVDSVQHQELTLRQTSLKTTRR
ncbi:predicted protein [Botrytis cinerea T4]|uniref:Uncharacterized protein n=1 Tax=Botryotinia fuckeliana (strain T4) TaxID=999810 RepID=G2Y9K0_BOTF4|nr:predicted protein [Botrytis cinerea T4]